MTHPHVSPDELLIVGAGGWLGARAVPTLVAAGHRVWAMQRSASTIAGVDSVLGDITQGPTEALLAQLPPQVAHIVVCVAPSSARGDSYALYPAAAAGARALAAAVGARTLLYVSSTGVYDRHDGSLVEETTPIVPRDARVQALADAEQMILQGASPTRGAVVLRPAGLYGPGRDPAPRFRSGLVAPETWCNFSWQDDVVSAIRHLLGITAPGTASVFNCTDNLPVQARAITAALGGTPSPDAAATTRSNQRVSSAALLSTGWRPMAPSIFDGLARLGHSLPGLIHRA